MSRPLIRKVDCVSLPVPDLTEALSFYRDRLGHEMVWRTSSAVGLRLGESDAELVLHTEARPHAAELLVEAVPAALSRFEQAGGSLVAGPFDIQIGKCAVVADPWGNHLVFLDMSKGPLRTDEQGNVVTQAVSRRREPMNDKHEANRRRWNAASPDYSAMAERSGSWQKAATEPGWAFLPQELALLGDVAGKRACVLGSGDNLAVFALAGLGAEVTSVDISEKQLDVARARAEKLGFRVRFLRADVTDLSDLQESAFDIVHTGRHVSVWVSDLRAYYREAVRILKPGGLFLVTEYHPFRRIFKDDPRALMVGWSYLDRGPFYHEVADALFDRRSGPHPSYESHWTIADLYHAIVEPGCELIAFDELGDEAEGWEMPPLAGLPQLILLAARKLPA